jgi:glycosyltransferase involved in cell wall biosynthesis
MDDSGGRRRLDPVRVLHLIDGLSGGGCERFLWDIVRLSPPRMLSHRVVTIRPERGDFVYADRLREAGAYRQAPTRSFLHRTGEAGHHPKRLKKMSMAHQLRRKVRRVAWYARMWRHLVTALVQLRPDVIHVHMFRGFTSGVLLRLLFRIPVVHTVPCLVSQMIDEGMPWMPKRYVRFGGSVDYFFTGYREELLGLGIPASKILAVNGVVNLNALNRVKAKREQFYTSIREDLQLPDDALIALSVGRLHPTKGHMFALEAIASLVGQFPALHWVLLGAGDQHAELLARADTLDVSRHVHILGFQEDPLPYYAAATLYLRTNILESENLSSYQAMAMGLPVIGFDTGQETELINKVGHGVLVPNQDAGALSRAIAEMLSLPDRGRAIGLRGVEYSQANLDIQQAVDQYTSVYIALRDRHNHDTSGQ